MCNLLGIRPRADDRSQWYQIGSVFSMQKWTEMSTLERFAILKDKGLCYQCLFPGAEKKGKHSAGRCQRDFECNHPSHDGFSTKKHVLVCDEHKDMIENRDLLQRFEIRCILRQNQQDLPAHAKDISLHYVRSSGEQAPDPVHEPVVETAPAPDEQGASYMNDSSTSREQFTDSVQDNSVYMLQTIQVGNKTFSLFYDFGCGDFVSRHNAIQRLGSRAFHLVEGRLKVIGVGDVQTQARHGVYGIKLPLADGGEASMAGRCMDRITETFPTYSLTSKIEENMRRGFHE